MHRMIATVLFIVMTAVGQGSAQTLYIPASANAEGVNQTRWRTDLEIKALGDAPASLTIELLESRQDNSDPRDHRRHRRRGREPPFGEPRLETEFGFTGTAALRLVATEGGIIATSRTYNDDPAGTYGQTVPAVADDDGLAFGTNATLIQLSRSPDPSTGFRTNIGLVNLVDSRTLMEVDLYRSDGSHLGTLTQNLKAFEHRQLNDVFYLAGADDVTDGYAVARTTSEDGRFIAYASVVDNGSGDAVFILGQAEVPPPPAVARLVVFESFMRPG